MGTSSSYRGLCRVRDHLLVIWVGSSVYDVLHRCYVQQVFTFCIQNLTSKGNIITIVGNVSDGLANGGHAMANDERHPCGDLP